MLELEGFVGLLKQPQVLQMIKIIIRDSQIPVIIDAGLRSPSEACKALEMGCEAVLVNSAIAAAENPEAMAAAFNTSVKSGRTAFHAGLMSTSDFAVASSPLTSFLSCND